MIAKLSDLSVGQVFNFDDDLSQYEITKKEDKPCPHYGLLGMEVREILGKQPFYIWIDTMTDEYRMYSQPIFGISDRGAHST